MHVTGGGPIGLGALKIFIDHCSIFRQEIRNLDFWISAFENGNEGGGCSNSRSIPCFSVAPEILLSIIFGAAPPLEQSIRQKGYEKTVQNTLKNREKLSGTICL